jgi:hypothetical protein
MLSMSENPASCTASKIGVRRRVFLALSLASLGGSDDALLSPDCMDLLLCRVEGAYDDFELAGLRVEVLEALVELPVVSTELLRNGGNSSLVSELVLKG